MKKLIAFAAVALVAAVPGHANVVLSDNFDGESAGTILNYGAFANFDVEDGTVDYLNAYPGLNCVSGGCVDLDGSTGNAGILVTKLGYAFNVGDVVTLSFDISGSQRGNGVDNLLWGFRSTAGAVSYKNLTISVDGSPFNFGNYLQQNAAFTTYDIPSNYGYSAYSVSFTAGTAGSIKAYVGNDGTDNIGPIVDNFKLDISAPAVPEPASWAMMIGGFAVAGAALRRRVAITRFA